MDCPLKSPVSPGFPVLQILGLLLAFALPIPARDEFVGPADYGTYLQALQEPGGEPAEPIAFQDLWSHPEAHAGRRVRVEGRVERRFLQPSRGAFPALTELWVVDAASNPFCLVHPTDRTAVPTGRRVQFTGTFLRRIRYQAANEERLAPLIVGPEPPQSLDLPGRGLPDASRLDGLIAAFLGLIVIVVLVLQHLKRRPTWPAHPGPPPLFLDTEVSGDDSDDGHED